MLAKEMAERKQERFRELSRSVRSSTADNSDGDRRTISVVISASLELTDETLAEAGRGGSASRYDARALGSSWFPIRRGLCGTNPRTADGPKYFGVPTLSFLHLVPSY